MKRITALSTILYLCLLLVACDGYKNDNSSEETKGVTSLVETTVTTSVGSTTETPSTTTAYVMPESVRVEVEAFVTSFVDTSAYTTDVDRHSIIYTAQSIPDYSFAQRITLDGQTITLPYSFSDLAALGWQCTDDTQMIDAPSTYGTITNYSGVNCSLTKGNDKKITVELFNYSNEAAPLNTCRGSRICLSYKPVFSRAAPEFVICGINKQDTIAQIVEKMGNPSEIEFSYYESGSSYKITFTEGDSCLTVLAAEDGTVTDLYYEYK